MDEKPSRPSRRDFLVASGFTLASGLVFTSAVTPARAQSGVSALGDAHVHLFNLADLPARGFFEHGVMWNTNLDFWIVRPMWPAMLDMICFLKSKAISAREELQSYQDQTDPAESISESEFNTLATRRISNMARQSGVYGGSYLLAPARPLSAAQRALRDSYYQMGAWFGLFGQPIWRRQPAEVADFAFLSDEDVDRIVRGGRFLHEGSCPEAARVASITGTKGTITSTFGWARMLTQSRKYQLKIYRDRIRDGDLRPRTIVNLLVDYDEWLGDGPAPGSEADVQIDLWNRIRDDYSRSLDIRTFAGFDPLKDGLERRGHRRADAPSDSTTFARNRADWRAERIHGFKLYPPMGFRPAGNDSSMFRGSRRSLGVVRARLAECGIPWDQLPDLLNGSLAEFYEFCGTNGVPVVAHALHTNEASLCSGARAGPAGWLDVLNEHCGLRICLAHFAEGRDFVRAARRHFAGRPVHPRDWPFRGTEELLRQNSRGRSEVFVDLSYMHEFLDARRGLGWVVAFFQALRTYCERYDEGCRHIMFGTDWVMLEREERNEDYVATIREGMNRARWTDEWQQNLLYGNLQRFLERRPPRPPNQSCRSTAA